MKLLALPFEDKNTESAYREQTANNTLVFCRIAWLIIPLLGGTFALLDQLVFGEAAVQVSVVRLSLILVGLLIFVLTFIPGMRRYLILSSGMYILLVGLFSIFLVSRDSTQQFSLYSLGLVMGFAAIFSTAGMGLRFSILAMLTDLLVFNVVFIFVVPLAPGLLMVYDFFLIGMILIFTYAAYLVERSSRQTFRVNRELKASLDRVRQLSGLLPICSSCKKIRDEQGTWSSVETYISRHSEADFTHSMCPDCAQKYYPGLPSSGERASHKDTKTTK